MAIDNANKRASILGLLPFVNTGTIDQFDRIHVSGLYRLGLVPAAVSGFIRNIVGVRTGKNSPAGTVATHRNPPTPSVRTPTNSPSEKVTIHFTT